jgi:hypothetical protein
MPDACSIASCTGTDVTIGAVNRRSFLSTASALAGTALTTRGVFAAAPRRTKHLVLFTSDGVRWQEIFTGIDPALMNEKSAGMGEAKDLREKLWKPSPEERRTALMPFFWNTLVPRGVLLGNLSKSSSVQVSNQYRVSYPGYSEILTGRAQDEQIKGNDPIQNPSPSFLQFLKERNKLTREQVAVFASWNMFHYIVATNPGALFVNAGYERAIFQSSPQTDAYNRLQFTARFLEDNARHDAFTFGLAMDYLDRQQPEHLYVSFDETDDWAHARRYDRVLQSLEFVDQALNDLWTYLQNSPKYKDSTTLVVTTDHGRGSTLQDFSGHGPKVAGAEQIWVFFIGPDTPATGEFAPSTRCQQRDIAPTMLGLLGIDHREFTGATGKPIRAAIG